jgi:putative toxin-antitoxin system antitoxin component (TIGR02293 family)
MESFVESAAMHAFEEGQGPVAVTAARVGAAADPAAALAMHDALVAGLPATALLEAVAQIGLLRDQKVFESIMAMSLRTFQRLCDTPEKRLDLAASGQLWRFAEIMARAVDLLGGQAAAEAWMAAPQTGLDQRRPIDLLATPAGMALVQDLLDRMDYGVYA